MTYIKLVRYITPQERSAAETNVTTPSVTNTYTHVLRMCMYSSGMGRVKMHTSSLQLSASHDSKLITTCTCTIFSRDS